MRSKPRTRRPSRCRRRSQRAATIVETAIALSLFVTLTLGMIDLGYGIFRQHVLAQATRNLARKAVVHGALADRLGSWGPDPISVTASSGNPVTESVVSNLVGWDPQDVQVDVEWIDGHHDVRQGGRVQVTMAAPYRPIMTFIFGRPSFTLRSTSTMHIAH